MYTSTFISNELTINRNSVLYVHLNPAFSKYFLWDIYVCENICLPEKSIYTRTIILLGSREVHQRKKKTYEDVTPKQEPIYKSRDDCIRGLGIM